MMRRLNLWSVALALILPLGLCAQYSDLAFSGQAFGSGAYGNDPHPDYGSSEGRVGWIPSLGYRKILGNGLKFEVLASYHSAIKVQNDKTETGSDIFDRGLGVYRSWAQISGPLWEARLGRQKLAFGPGQFLRPLAWFDTIDLRDPTGQTGGVDALRFRAFPTDHLTIWTWGILPDVGSSNLLADLSPGGRAEYISGNYETGITVHYRGDSAEQGVGLLPPLLKGPELRLAYDLRADLFVGLWTEAVVALADNALNDYASATLLMVGTDYTLPVGDGVMLMAEHQLAKANGAGKNADVTSQATALMASVPLGFLDNLMAVAYFDHESDFGAFFLMWQRTYDNFSLSTIVSANPSRSELGEFSDNFPSVVGVGTSVQLVLNFYH